MIKTLNCNPSILKILILALVLNSSVGYAYCNDHMAAMLSQAQMTMPCHEDVEHPSELQQQCCEACLVVELPLTAYGSSVKSTNNNVDQLSFFFVSNNIPPAFKPPIYNLS
jgi:hypothetical protein